MWDDKDLYDAVKNAKSYNSTFKNIGVKYSGHRMKLLKKDIERLGIDVSHFTRYRIPDEQLIEAVKVSDSYADVIRNIGTSIRGSNIEHYKSRIKKLNLDISHFYSKKKEPWNKGRTVEYSRKKKEDILVRRTDGYRTKAYLLSRAMVESGMKEQCSDCKLGKIWNDKELVLQVDHIDGDRFNNLLENLRFLCPNCHTQTKTYGAKNRKV